MRFKNEVNLGEEPPIPDRLRTKMVRILRGAKRIVVREQTGEKSFKQVNAMLLKVDNAREMPAESVDEIIEGAARIMHARWIEKNEDAETADPIMFRIQSECVPGGSTRRRPMFGIKWDPEDASDGPDLMDADEIREDVLMELVDRLRAQGDRDSAYIEELHNTILEQARMNTEPIAQASSMGKQATDLLQQGFAMFQSALMTQYSQEAARATEEGKNKRSQEMWDRLDKYFAFGSKAAGDQLGAFIKRKMGGGNAASEEEVRRARRATRKTAPEEDDEEEDDEEEAEEEEETEETEVPEPIAIICEVFGSSLTPEQRKRMREILKPETMALFDDLFCSKTDDEAIGFYKRVRDEADLTQLMELYVLLDATQTEWLEKVAEAVASAESEDDDA